MIPAEPRSANPSTRGNERTDFVCPAKHAWAQLDVIEIQQRARPYNATEVVASKLQIQAIGLQTPLTVVERDGRYVLVAGRHRLEALRLLKAERVPVRIVTFDDAEARLWTISENLHRAELTEMQRAQQIAEFASLSQQKHETEKSGRVAGDAISSASCPEIRCRSDLKVEQAWSPGPQHKPSRCPPKPSDRRDA